MSEDSKNEIKLGSRISSYLSSDKQVKQPSSRNTEQLKQKSTTIKQQIVEILDAGDTPQSMSSKGSSLLSSRHTKK